MSPIPHLGINSPVGYSRRICTDQPPPPWVWQTTFPFWANPPPRPPHVGGGPCWLGAAPGAWLPPVGWGVGAGAGLPAGWRPRTRSAPSLAAGLVPVLGRGRFGPPAMVRQPGQTGPKAGAPAGPRTGLLQLTHGPGCFVNHEVFDGPQVQPPGCAFLVQTPRHASARESWRSLGDRGPRAPPPKGKRKNE